MLRRYKPLMIQKVVADANTPEFLAPNDGTPRLHGILFVAEKAVGTDNDDDVFIQIDGEDALKLSPGQQISWPPPPYEGGYYLAEDFKVRVTTDNDGIRAIANILP